MKKKNRTYGVLLIIVYIAMVLLMLYLGNASTVLINLTLFIIVGVIFFNSIRLFRRINKITADLNQAVEKIKSDYGQGQGSLWDKYINNTNAEPMLAGELSENYVSYISECHRLSAEYNGLYKCDIEDYINKNTIDTIAKKNVYNLIPGTMTGLGILGTFIGLSLGLQQFNTGNAEEISNSIAPLMNGIKVAFHTSIYGMIFSLVYNYAYKQTIEQAYHSLDVFLETYRKLVAGNQENKAYSSIQSAINNLPAAFGSQMQTIMSSLFEGLNDRLEKINTSFDSFTMKVSDNQMEGMSKLVDKFVDEMNESMGGNFEKLGKVIEDTCSLQEKNTEYMRVILENIDGMISNITDINEISEKTIENMSSYVENIEALQKIINENFTNLEIQAEEQRDYNEKMQEYVTQIADYELKINESTKDFSNDMSRVVESLYDMEKAISESTNKSIEVLASKAEEYGNALAEAAKKQIQELLSISSSNAGEIERAANELTKATNDYGNQFVQSINDVFATFDTELAGISKHLSGTISEIDVTTGRVPEVVNAAYEGMQKSFDEMQIKLDTLTHQLDIMQRNMPRLINEIDKSSR